jgi:hypothetical protein
MIGIGLILILAGLVATWFALRLRATIKIMEETPTTPVSGIRSSGYFEVKGKAVCQGALSAPRSGAPCIYYHHKITEQYEESYQDDEGEYRTRTKTRTVLNETRHCNFGIQDRTGTLSVSPDGATFEGDWSKSGLIGPGDSSWKAEMAAQAGCWTTEYQGQREEITVIPVGVQLYAIGAVEHHPDGLAMQADKAEGRAFRISTKSEEDQLASLGLHLKLAAVGSAGGLLGGLALVLKGFAER